MSVYKLNGDALQSVYDITGNYLQQAYDINGNELLDNMGMIFNDFATVINTYTSSLNAYPQGGCMDDEGNVCAIFPTIGKFIKHNINTGVETQYSFTPNVYGHGNGMTYNPFTECFYVASMKETGEVYVFNKSFELIDTLYARDENDNVFTCYNIAYNRNTEQFITLRGLDGGRIIFYDNDFNRVTQVSFDINDWADTRQDIETDGNYIYAVSYNPNKIFVFNFQGDVIKEISNTGFIGEPEALCFDWSGNFYMSGKDSYFVIRKTEIIDGDLQTIKVMSYNVGNWYIGSGTNVPTAKKSEYEQLIRDILTNNDCDIVAFQEYWSTFCADGTTAVSILDDYYSSIDTIDGTTTYMGKGICMNMVPKTKVTQSYTQQSGTHKRFRVNVVEINNHDVYIISCHLDWSNKTIQYSQVQDLLNYVSDKDYFIICGDFNPTIRVTEDRTGTDYINVAKPFIDAGYNMANWKNSFIATAFNGTGLDDSTSISCLDNIITSANILIFNVQTDIEKLIDNVLDKIDHIPIVATLVIQ